MKFNLGCGTDIRQGWVNVDAHRGYGCDYVDDLARTLLLNDYGAGCAEHVLMNDILEHLFRWEAVNLLRIVFALLKPLGTVRIRVPDCAYIIESKVMALEHKLTMLYGGQDIPMRVNKEMDEVRRISPHLFCHKSGWTQHSMSEELSKIGFIQIVAVSEGVNFVATAAKPSI